VKASYDPETKDPYVPILQAWGAHRRFLNPDYWVSRLFFDIQDLARDNETMHVAIDDVRYDNERKMLEQIGVRLVEIRGPQRKEKPEHESERDWRIWSVNNVSDFIILNQGDQTEFFYGLDCLVFQVFPYMAGRKSVAL
jgi:hypothetical protein